MYIKHETKGIINLNCYPRIDVVEDGDNYFLVAFIKAEQDNEQSQNKYYYKHSITIMKFVTEVDAMYCLGHLYRSISNDRKTWDPREIYLPSNAWETIVEKFCEKSRYESHKLLSDTALVCEGMRKIIVSHNNIGEVYWTDMDKDIEDLKNMLKASLELPVEVEWKPRV